jgi:hypothetical protein
MTSERLFGICLPEPGQPAPFRVLISIRWIWAGFASTVAALGLALLLPPQRRLSALFSGASVAGLSLLGIALAQARRLTIEHVELPVHELAPTFDGLTIVQISDIHLGHLFTLNNLRKAIAWTKRQSPDLILFTGDFAYHTDTIPVLRAELRGLQARYGVYAVLGNHDYMCVVYTR